MERIAAAYGVTDARVAVLPDVVLAAGERDAHRGPPQLATFLPAFWMLVPGAVGLIGMAEFVGSDRARRARPLRPRDRRVRVDRARRARRQRARAAIYVELIPPSTGSVTPVT